LGGGGKVFFATWKKKKKKKVFKNLWGESFLFLWINFLKNKVGKIKIFPGVGGVVFFFLGGGGWS